MSRNPSAPPSLGHRLSHSILTWVIGAILFVTGMYWGWALASAVLGILADIIAGAGRFRTKPLNLIAFVVHSLSPMGSYIMLWVNPSGYTAYLTGRGTEQAYMSTMESTATGWMLPAMTLATVVCALISGLAGMGRTRASRPCSSCTRRP